MVLSLVTAEKKVLSDVEIDEVIVPGYRGELDILPGHAPLMTTLTAGIVRWRLAGSSTFESAAVGWGYCEVSPKGVVILAESAETKEEVDKERDIATLRETEKLLNDPSLAPDEIEKLQRKMKRSQARLDLLNSLNHTHH